MSASTNTPGAPQPFDDIVSGNELASTLHEQDQQVHRATLESNLLAATTQRVPGDVELEVAKPEGLGHIRRLHHAGEVREGVGVSHLAVPIFRRTSAKLQPHSMARRAVGRHYGPYTPRVPS